MKSQTVIFVFALLLASITCITNNKPKKESAFDEAVRITREANKHTERFGHAFFDRAEGKTDKGIPLQSFVSQIKQIFGDVKPSDNPLVYDFDLNKNGFIDREEAGLAFRNIIIAYGRDVAFKGLEYAAPEGKVGDAINKIVGWVADKYNHVQKQVNKLFDGVDLNKNGLLSTGKFLETFTFPKTDNLKTIIETVNPTGEEKINKDQAFYLFCLLVLESQVHEEGKGIKVAGAEESRGHSFLQKKH
jgi:hypothetical protein